MVSAGQPDRPQKEIGNRVPALQPLRDPPEKVENSVLLLQSHLGPQQRQGYAVLVHVAARGGHLLNLRQQDPRHQGCSTEESGLVAGKSERPGSRNLPQ